MGSQDNLISKEFLLELNRLVSLKELQLESLDNLGATISKPVMLNYVKKTNTDVPNLDGLLYLLGRISRRRVIRRRFTAV